MLFSGAYNPPKLPLPLGGSGPLSHMVPWAHPTHILKWHLNVSVIFCRAVEHDQQTHTDLLTDQSRHSVANALKWPFKNTVLQQLHIYSFL